MNQKEFIIQVQALLMGMTGLVAGVAFGGAEPGGQFKLRDFPPSPFDTTLSTNTWPKPDPIVLQVERDLKLSVVSTNGAEMALIAEVRDLKSKFLAVQAAANANDPLLQVYGQYLETAHDWVVKNHQREFSLANQYFQSNSAPSKQRALTRVVDLIDMALYKELASNTNFAPLFRSVFETLERKLPGLQFGGSYARNDTLIGFQPTTPPKPVGTFEAYLKEINQRYDLVLTKLDQIQQEEGIPAEVITGWMYGDLYRMLDGSAQQYVMLNTPDEMKKLQEELRRKCIELSELRASAR